MSGVEITRSKSNFPLFTVSAKSSLPTISAPAASASFAFESLANTATLTVFPVPSGKFTTPRTI